MTPGGLRVLESHQGGRLLRVERAAITLLGAVILATTAGCQQQPPDTRGTSEERNKALVRRWIEEGFNRRSLTVVDDIFAEQLTVNGQTIGRDDLKSMSRHLAGFPDLQVTIDDILADGEKVGIW